MTDAATGLLFPGGSNQWLRIGFHEHEPKERFGVSYAYKREGMVEGTLTCYVYNLGLTDIPDGADSDRVRIEMYDTIRSVPAVWAPQGATVTELWPVSAIRTQGDNRLVAYLGAHLITQGDTANVSLSVVSAYKGSFFKLRYTFPGRDLQAAIDDLTGFVYLLCKANGVELPQLNLVKEPMKIAGMKNVAISFNDRRLPQTTAGAFWTAYGVMRLKYREDNGLPLPEKGDVRPSFEEEVFARSQAVKVYNEVLARDPGCADSYWSTLAAVEAQGFMKAYVWTHHHRYDWPDKSQPRDLAKFRKWQKKNLKKHVPQTPVILEMQEEAGEKVQARQEFLE